MHTSTCPACEGPGHPSNFGGTCDPCKAQLNDRTIDLRTAEADTQATAAAERREQYAR